MRRRSPVPAEYPSSMRKREMQGESASESLTLAVFAMPSRLTALNKNKAVAASLKGYLEYATYRSFTRRGCLTETWIIRTTQD